MDELFFLASIVVALTIRVPRPPSAGETLVGDSFDLGPGGKGLNQAIAARRQGAGVSMIAAVGDDLLAGVAMGTIATEGLDARLVRKMEGINTGVGFVTLDARTADNTIVIDPGANLRLTDAHIQQCAKEIRTARMVISPLELPDAPVLEAFRIAKRYGVKTLLNPAPARPLPPELLGLTDLLTPNETEANMLLGLSGEDDIPPEILGRRLMGELGIGQVVMTLGRRGAMVFSNESEIRIPSVSVTAVDPTGAGDCFNATLAVGLIGGLSLVDAASRAAAAGAYCAQHLGVIAGLPTALELDTFIQSH
ncbi:MAG: ribokinase [Tepidisphaeraceae bacterium]